MKKTISANIKLSTASGELGAFILRKSQEYECSYSAVIRKMIKDARDLEEKKRLKNMPIFKK